MNTASKRTGQSPVALACGPSVAAKFETEISIRGAKPTPADYLECLHIALRADAGSYAPGPGKTTAVPVEGEFLPD
jgi:hypothetical protein